MPVLEREHIADREMNLVGASGAFEDSDPTSLIIPKGDPYKTKIYPNSGTVQVLHGTSHVFLPIPLNAEEAASSKTPSNREVLDAGNGLDAHGSLVFISQQVYEMLGDNSGR